jgi:APA family basic amino acid/polyamine antiporter
MAQGAVHLKRSIGVFTAITIIVGSMIGSGILLLPADMLHQIPSPPLVMLAFVVAALMTAVGALTVAELSGMFPRAGGQYVYLREAFGPMPAYLFGWTTFWVIQTGTVAAVAVAFAKVLSRFVPLAPAGAAGCLGTGCGIDLGPWHVDLLPFGQSAVAIAVILLLSAVNYLGVRWGGAISNVSTVAKAAGLLGLVLIVALFAHPGPGAFGPLSPVHQEGAAAGSPFSVGELVAGFAVALTLILFAYDGWYSATYVAGEVRNPRRDVPLALLLGPLATTVIYLAVAAASLYAVPLMDALHLGPSEYLAGRAADNAIGSVGGTLVSLLALVSIFGTVNAFVLTCPRIAYAQAKEGFLFRGMARLSPRNATPGFAMLLTAIWSSLLVLTGLYDQLAITVVFAVFVFHVPTALAQMRLRRTRPDLERPFRTPGGPVIPVLFILSSTFVVAALLSSKYLSQAIFALVVIAIGAVAYAAQRKNRPVADAGTETPAPRGG